MSGALDFLMALELRKENYTYLTQLEKELGSARIKGETYCLQCGFCCHRRTCIPTPQEIFVIADYLKMTPKDMINKYFMIDTHRDSSGVYYLRPLGVNVTKYAGKIVPDLETYTEGKCIFLTEENNCAIHPVKPKAAKEVECWTEDTSINVEEWKDNQLKKHFGIDGEELEENNW